MAINTYVGHGEFDDVSYIAQFDSRILYPG